jgi:hypothetical protein
MALKTGSGISARSRDAGTAVPLELNSLAALSRKPDLRRYLSSLAYTQVDDLWHRVNFAIRDGDGSKPNRQRTYNNIPARDKVAVGTLLLAVAEERDARRRKGATFSEFIAAIPQGMPLGRVADQLFASTIALSAKEFRSMSVADQAQLERHLEADPGRYDRIEYGPKDQFLLDKDRGTVYALRWGPKTSPDEEPSRVIKLDSKKASTLSKQWRDELATFERERGDVCDM